MPTSVRCLCRRTVLQGQQPEHLPEQLLGTIRLSNLDLGTASYLDEGSGRVLKSAEEL